MWERWAPAFARINRAAAYAKASACAQASADKSARQASAFAGGIQEATVGWPMTGDPAMPRLPRAG
jgi:hypothetical protein